MPDTSGGSATPVEPPQHHEADPFLRALYVGLLSEGTRVEVRCLPQPAPRSFASTLADAARDALEHSGRHNVYVGPGLRRAEGRRGRAEDVVVTQVVWADADFKGGFSRETRWAQLMSLDPVPDMVVDSGGGYQPWWYVEPYGPERHDLARSLMDLLAHMLGSDHVSDPARVMRVPGTQNLKYDDHPFAKIVRYRERDQHVWTLDGLYARLSASTPPEAQSAPMNGSPPGGVQDVALVGDYEGARDFEKRVEAGGTPAGERNPTLFRWVQLRRNEGTPERLALVLAKGVNATFAPPLDEDEVRKVVRSVYGWEQFDPRETGPVDVVASAGSTESKTLWTMREIVALAEQPVEWLSPGMFERGDIVYMPNPVKGGKTTILLNIAMRIASGTSDGLVQPLRPYRVLIIQQSSEMKPRKMRDWIRRLAPYFPGAADNLDVCMDPDRAQAYAFAMANGGRYDMVIVDTLSRLLPGADDKDTLAVAAAIDKARALRAQWPETVWVYAVQIGKQSLQFTTSDQEAFSVRGNSAIGEAYDTLIAIRIPDDSDVNDHGDKLNRTLHLSGRSAGDYRKPFRTRYDTTAGLVTVERELRMDEIVKQSKTSIRRGAAQVLARVFSEHKSDVLCLKDILDHRIVDENEHAYVVRDRWDDQTLRRALTEELFGVIAGKGRGARWHLGTISSAPE